MLFATSNDDENLMVRALVSRIRELECESERNGTRIGNLETALSQSPLRQIYKAMFPRAVDFNADHALSTILQAIESENRA